MATLLSCGDVWQDLVIAVLAIFDIGTTSLVLWQTFELEAILDIHHEPMWLAGFGALCLAVLLRVASDVFFYYDSTVAPTLKIIAFPCSVLNKERVLPGLCIPVSFTGCCFSAFKDEDVDDDGCPAICMCCFPVLLVTIAVDAALLIVQILGNIFWLLLLSIFTIVCVFLGLTWFLLALPMIYIYKVVKIILAVLDPVLAFGVRCSKHGEFYFPVAHLPHCSSDLTKYYERMPVPLRYGNMILELVTGGRFKIAFVNNKGSSAGPVVGRLIIVTGLVEEVLENTGGIMLSLFTLRKGGDLEWEGFLGLDDKLTMWIPLISLIISLLSAVYETGKYIGDAIAVGKEGEDQDVSAVEVKPTEDEDDEDLPQAELVDP